MGLMIDPWRTGQRSRGRGVDRTEIADAFPTQLYAIVRCCTDAFRVGRLECRAASTGIRKQSGIPFALPRAQVDKVGALRRAAESLRGVKPLLDAYGTSAPTQDKAAQSLPANTERSMNTGPEFSLAFPQKADGSAGLASPDAGPGVGRRRIEGSRRQQCHRG